MNDELINAMAELKRVKVIELVKKEIQKGTNPLKIIESLSQGVKIVGDLFEKKEYFLAELITGGDIFQDAFQELKPYLEKESVEAQSKGKIVIGTVAGDIHDIGKNIVSTMLSASGFIIKDVGVDVPKEKFLEAIKQENADILGLSALLTTAIPSVKDVVELLKRENLRGHIKIIVGGSAFNEDIAKKLNVDAYGKDPLEAIKKCQKFLK